MNWEQVEDSERFQAYDQRMKNHVKAQWFKEYVTPSDEFQAYDDDRKMRVLSGFFSDPLPEGEEPGYGMVVAKSVVRGFENLAGGVGSLGRWAGDVLDYSDLEEAGKSASKYFREAAQEGWEAPDPRIFGGTFWENPSLKRAFGIVGEAAPSYTVAIAASMIGGSPAWGAGMLGLLEGGPQAEEAMEAGLSTAESSVVGLASTLGTAVLEYLPISRLLKRKGGFVTGALKGGVEESAQEVTQTVWQNLIAKVGYDETRELAEGIIESAIGGFGVGGPAGGVVSSLNKARAAANDKLKKLREDALQKGVTNQEMDAVVSSMQDQLKTLTEDDVKRVMAEYAEPEIQDLPQSVNKRLIAQKAEALGQVPALPPGGQFVLGEEGEVVTGDKDIGHLAENPFMDVGWAKSDYERGKPSIPEQRRQEFIEKDSVKKWGEEEFRIARQIELEYGEGYKPDIDSLKKMVSDRKFWDREAEKHGIEPIYPGAKTKKPTEPVKAEKSEQTLEQYIEAVKTGEIKGVKFPEKQKMDTGQVITKKRDAGKMLAKTDSKIDVYNKILNCLG